VYLSAAGGGANLLPCLSGAVDPGGCWIPAQRAGIQGGIGRFTVGTKFTAQNYTWWVQSWRPDSISAWSLGQTFTVVTERFEDLGKTVLDHLTGLEWEKKVSSPSNSIHYYANTYTWSLGAMGSPPVYPPNGTAFTTFLAGLNAGPCVGSSPDGTTVDPGQDCSFAAHGDWRLPTISELRSILDCTNANCIPPIFGPTQGNIYWSSSMDSGNAGNAWAVPFSSGEPAALSSSVLVAYYVRVVRTNRMPAVNSQAY
jgi:hypothetical protein